MIQIGIRRGNRVFRNGTGMRHMGCNPAGFDCNESSGDEEEEQRENSVKEDTAQKKDSDGNQNRISSHRRRKSLVHGGRKMPGWPVQ